MKLRTRLAVSFLTVTVVPMLLIYMAFVGISGYQTEIIRKNYGLSEQIDLFSGNSMQMFNSFWSEFCRWFALVYRPADTHCEVYQNGI